MWDVRRSTHSSAVRPRARLPRHWWESLLRLGRIFISPRQPIRTREQAQLIPRKFYDLMPHLKASDFDYIIFDMPPFSQTSITLPMARFMDKVVLVAEAEKSSKDIVKRANTELTSCRSQHLGDPQQGSLLRAKWVGVEG